MALTKEQFENVKSLFRRYFAASDVQERTVFVRGTLFGFDRLGGLQYGGTSDTFADGLADTLYEHNYDGKPALSAILTEIRGRVGTNWYAEIDTLNLALSDATPLTLPQTAVVAQDDVEQSIHAARKKIIARADRFPAVARTSLSEDNRR